MKKISELVSKLKPIKDGVDPTRDKNTIAYAPFVKVGESQAIKFRGRKNIVFIACSCRNCKRWWNVSPNMMVLGIGYTCPTCSWKKH